MVNGLAEPDDPSLPLGEIRVVVTTPEEFAGSSLHELTALGASIGGIEADDGSVSIKATLPTSHYNALVEATTAWTQGRGRVALAES
jgi:translation elongation factor EF-G